MGTLFEHAGGEAALLRLAQAHHARCLADPELSHPFSHDDLDPQHVQRLAAYWTQVLGGPPAYTALGGTQRQVLELHAGNGDLGDLGERFLACFLLALDDAGLPGDPPFREALRAYMVAAVADVALGHPDGVVPGDPEVPRWDWAGPAS